MADIKEVSTTNRTECENRCLNEFNFVCRSATYDAALRSCTLSRFTRRTHPELLEDDPNSDYLENTCLNAEHRCDGLAVFVKEENKRLRGPFEVDIYTNLTLTECQALCLRAEKYFCRSVEFDEQTRQCVISEEDSVSQRDDIGISSSPSYHFYDLVCLDNHPSIARGSEYPNNGASHLFTDGRRPDTAFQRYRNSRLSGEFHSEITGRSLSECLDECLRQTSFQCRSAVYSEHYRTCRLSRFNQRDGHRIIYDADYDYYENLMHQYMDSGDKDVYRPDPLGQDTNYGRPSLGRPGYPDDFPQKPDKFPDRFSDKYPDKYPEPYPDRYPDRYPYVGGRYPIPPPHMYPEDPDRYPLRYPPMNRPYYPNRYPTSDRFPPGDRYPTNDRYPIGDDRYPSKPDRYPIGDDRFPSKPDRYPVGDDRYPGKPDRYPTAGAIEPGPGAGRPPGIDRYPATGPPGRYSPRYPSDVNPIPPVNDYPLPGDRYSPIDRYPISDNSVDRYPPSGGGGGPPPHRYPTADRYPDKDIYYYSDRRPGLHGKEYERPYNYAGGEGPYGSPRPPHYPGFSEGDVVGGGYVGEGGVFHTRPFENGGGPIIGRPPLVSRCDEQENFRQVEQRTRVKKPFIRRYTTASSLAQCERECADARDFVCRSFNFRPYAALFGAERDNCELSDRDSRDMEKGNPIYYDTGSDYDFYERNSGQSGLEECLDVSQVCSEDGMEFTLRTPEGFIGRIYTYGYYDRCFFRGNGGTVNVLRISGPQGYPECGTQRYGDTMTNIVVVQFSDYVQTGRDKRFNLTCLFRGPDEAVVTSGYIGAGRSGSPIPIEYLPAENTMSSRVRLLILYQGRPTTTIAVGDPLTFRLEATDGYNYPADIFATNVIARDPYSGRSVQLIDRFGCPVDNYVFPGLDRLRDGDSLEARFNAFKIPESNFLVFEATVGTCRNGCQPAYCSSSTGRSEPSFGRRRRDVKEVTNRTETSAVTSSVKKINDSNKAGDGEIKVSSSEENEEEHVREMIEVYDSRMDMIEEDKSLDKQKRIVETVCIESNEYYSLVTSVITLVVLLVSIALLAFLIYRKYIHTVIIKNRRADKASGRSVSSMDINSTRANNFSFLRSGLHQPSYSMPAARSLSHIINQRMTSATTCTTMSGAIGLSKDYRTEFDPSEPIYTDPSLFEIASQHSATIDPTSRHDNNFHLM